MPKPSYPSFQSADVERTSDDVIVVRLHTGDGPLVWDAVAHAELPELLGALARDRSARSVVLTGTGDAFITWDDEHGAAMADGTLAPHVWNRVQNEGNRMITALLEIEVPVIAAVNGPAHAHSELAVLADVVLASPNASFRDEPHFRFGLVPGDGMQVIWPLLLGPNAGRHFLLSGRELGVEEAVARGVVAEVVERETLVSRALEMASDFARLNPVLLRNTRRVLTLPLRRAMAEQLDLGLALEALASVSNAAWTERQANVQPRKDDGDVAG